LKNKTITAIALIALTIAVATTTTIQTVVVRAQTDNSGGTDNSGTPSTDNNTNQPPSTDNSQQPGFCDRHRTTCDTARAAAPAIMCHFGGMVFPPIHGLCHFIH
jgi:hypothetical protein